MACELPLIAPCHEQVEKIPKGGDKSGDIGQCGGIEHGIHTGGLLAWSDNPHLLQDGLGAGRGIEFDRQGNQLENHQERVAGDADGDQPSHVKDETADDHEGKDLLGELRGRHDLHPEIERAVVFAVLECVAALVGGDTHRGDGVPVVHVRGEAEPFCGRIVVVAE